MKYEELSARSENQLALARELGIDVPDDISARELSRLIAAAPASPNQRRFAANLLGFELPDTATFGQASKLLDGLVPMKNQVALATVDWHEGDVLLWRGTYLRIVSMRPPLYRVYLKPVDLEPSPPGEPCTVVDRNEPQEWHHPVTLVAEDLNEGDPERAVKVNLLTHNAR